MSELQGFSIHQDLCTPSARREHSKTVLSLYELVYLKSVYDTLNSIIINCITTKLTADDDSLSKNFNSMVILTSDPTVQALYFYSIYFFNDISF